MSGGSAELHDYDVIRRLERAAVLAPSVTAAVIVLGSRQPDSQVRDGELPVRRRRGGGGAVLLRPGDLWLDFWIPATDPRHRDDVRAAAALVGAWWRDALAAAGVDGVRVHIGPGAPAVVCFGSIGDGEVERVVHDGPARKVVGLTQWRVREGSLLSTVLPAHSTRELTDHLVGAEPVDHDALDTLGLVSGAAVLRDDVLARAGALDVVALPAIP